MDLEDDFKILETSYKICGKIRTYDLIEVEVHEYRRNYPLYYSRIFRYKLLGYFFDKNPFNSSDCLNSVCCFSTMNKQFECIQCNKLSDKVFLNCRIFLSYASFKKIEKKYNLGETEEFMRDQRVSLCNPIKEGIIELAMHPDRIMKILDLTNDHWANLYKYI